MTCFLSNRRYIYSFIVVHKKINKKLVNTYTINIFTDPVFVLPMFCFRHNFLYTVMLHKMA
jgi:hypothetical protein